MRNSHLLGAASSLVLAAMTPAAIAQSPESAQYTQPAPEPSGKERAPGPYEPAGMRAGAFLVFPKAELTEEYNSNIYKAAEGEEGDYITTLAPSVAARSDWSRHSLSANAGASLGYYGGNSDDNFVDYDAGVRGRLDATRALTFNANAQFRHLHEERGGDDVSSDAAEPVEYDRVSGRLGGRYKANRVSVEGFVAADDYNYDDNPEIGGGSTNNDDRDRKEFVEQLRLGYEVQPGYEAFVRGELNQRAYDAATDDTGVNRDSDGYKVQGGLAVELTRLLRADLGVGYFEQSYDDATLKDASGLSTDGRLRWSVTRLTTVRGRLSRSVSETTTANVSGTVDTSIALGVDHELLRNLVLKADAQFTNTEYEGDPNDREDDRIGLSGGAEYKLNRNFYSALRYSYTDRDSSIDSNDYKRHQVVLRLGAQF